MIYLDMSTISVYRFTSTTCNIKHGFYQGSCNQQFVDFCA